MVLYKFVTEDISTALAAQNIEAATGTFGENTMETRLYTMKYRGRMTTLTYKKAVVGGNICTAQNGSCHFVGKSGGFVSKSEEILARSEDFLITSEDVFIRSEDFLSKVRTFSLGVGTLSQKARISSLEARTPPLRVRNEVRREIKSPLRLSNLTF
jgi:hypothetical protein